MLFGIVIKLLKMFADEKCSTKIIRKNWDIPKPNVLKIQESYDFDKEVSSS